MFSVSNSVFSFYVASGVTVTSVTTDTTVTTVTTVTKVTTVGTVNSICVLWQYFVLSKYLQFLTPFLAVSHCVFSFSLCFQFHNVFVVSHCVFSFSLCFTLSYYRLL